jgi:hypothetical protein
MRLLTLCCTALIMTSGFLFAQEPVKPQLTPRIITATKQVTMFTSLENQMLQAVQKKNRAALGSMVSDDCSIHLPDADLMPGDDWVNSVMYKGFVLKKFIIRQMDVADLGTAAVVSYVRIQESSYQGKPDGGEFYVMDLWKKNGDSWKLSDRYVTKVATTPYMPKAPVKPTGKQ